MATFLNVTIRAFLIIWVGGRQFSFAKGSLARGWRLKAMLRMAATNRTEDTDVAIWEQSQLIAYCS